MAKFKVGDRVKISENNTNDSKIYNGREGVLMQIDNSRIPYEVKFDGGNVVWVTEVTEIGEVKPYIPKAPTHLVIWDEEDRDPCKLFTSEDEAKNFLKELSENSEVIKESILLVEIKSVKKVKIQKSLKYTQHKI